MGKNDFGQAAETASSSDFKLPDDFKVTVIGLGLIGGSLVRALSERAGIKNIIAVNRTEKAVQMAVEDGFAIKGFTEVNKEVLDSDIIFICTPVKPTINYIDDLAGKVKPDCILTDVCSTKSEIINHVNKMSHAPVFVGGHPMAGTEKNGYSEGFSHMFENAFYILSPANTTTKNSLDVMSRILSDIGAISVTLDAEEHDRIAAAISHLPHIIAASLVNLVRLEDSSDGTMRLLAAGGFRDITRIASSSPVMWENITLSNKKQIKSEISEFIKLLRLFEGYIDNNDSKAILDFLENARTFRNSFDSTQKGLIAPAFELVIDVLDKPGIIGEITTVLGTNDINIKNIQVANSRESEQGCLIVTLADYKNVERAFDILSDKGYKVYINT